MRSIINSWTVRLPLTNVWTWPEQRFRRESFKVSSSFQSAPVKEVLEGVVIYCFRGFGGYPVVTSVSATLHDFCKVGPPLTLDISKFPPETHDLLRGLRKLPSNVDRTLGERLASVSLWS